MASQDLSRSRALNNVPEKKLQEKILNLVQTCPICSVKGIKIIEQASDGLCEKCSIMTIAYNRYAIANIPYEFWSLDMKDFKGAKDLAIVYDNYISKISDIYNAGSSICLASNHGAGKSTVATNILKKAAQRNYICQYTTFCDIINALIDSPFEEKFIARRELMMADFLVVDEFDARYVSDASSDLFGKQIEHIFRNRSQNKLPTIFCSNSPNPVEMFNGTIKASIESLFARVRVIPIMSNKDFRKELK